MHYYALMELTTFTEASTHRTFLETSFKVGSRPSGFACNIVIGTVMSPAVPVCWLVLRMVSRLTLQADLSPALLSLDPKSTLENTYNLAFSETVK